MTHTHTQIKRILMMHPHTLTHTRIVGQRKKNVSQANNLFGSWISRSLSVSVCVCIFVCFSKLNSSITKVLYPGHKSEQEEKDWYIQKQNHCVCLSLASYSMHVCVWVFESKINQLSNCLPNILSSLHKRLLSHPS